MTDGALPVVRKIGPPESPPEPIASRGVAVDPAVPGSSRMYESTLLLVLTITFVPSFKDDDEVDSVGLDPAGPQLPQPMIVRVWPTSSLPVYRG